jgi:exopolysaccharide production protein ExoZ
MVTQTAIVKETRTSRYQGLQILRAMAACMVVLTHSTFYTSERLGHGQRVWHRGVTGVDIFFVLSGFVMIFSSQRLFSDPDGWKIFAERRIVRIVPMYWLLTTYKALIMIVAGGLVLHASLSLPKLLFSYFFLPTYNLDGELRPVLGVGWTLNFEMFFYFLFTLALVLRTNVYRFVGVILTLLAIGAYFRQPSWPPVAFYLDTMVIEFFFGMLIAWACLNRRPLPPALGLILLFGGLATLLFIPDFGESVPRALFWGVPAAMMVWGMASLEKYLTHIPGVVLYLAEASYVIYLIHPLVAPGPVVVMAKLHLYQPTVAVILAVLFAVLAGCALHRFIERPVTNWFRDHLRVRHQKIIHVH